MLAGVLHGSRNLQVERVPSPALKPGQVLLRVRRAGVCGSDLHYFVHGRCGNFVPTRPFILGHEFVATVDAVADGVERPRIGERVVVNPAASCGQCESCKSGRANLCSRVVMLGSASTNPPTDGAFAEYVVVPAHQCYPVPETMDDIVAALMEPLSVALHAVRRANGVAGCRVLVCGGGPIGLITALAARAFGASLVVVSEPTESRRRMAGSLEIEMALDPAKSDFVKQALALSDGGFDIVFEASGAAAAIRTSLEAVRRGGTIVQIGTVAADSVALPVNDIMARELSFLGTFRYANEFPQAIRLVASGRIDLSRLVTDTYSLSEIPRAMDFASTSSDALKVHVIVSD